MTDREKAEIQIKAAVEQETQAAALSDKLFSPGGLFSRLASSEEERAILVRSSLFRDAQKRFRELQYAEAAEFSRTMPAPPDGFTIKLERSPR